MLHMVPHTVPRVGRSFEHLPDGFEFHLLLNREPVSVVENKEIEAKAV